MDLLLRGVSINKKRFRNDIDIFKGVKKTREEEQVLVQEEDLSDFKNEEEIGRFKNMRKIKVYSSDCPAPVKNLEHYAQKYKVNESLIRKCRDLGYIKLTPVQLQTVPLIEDQRDAIICAHTGQGKTLAFTLPIMNILKEHQPVIRVLVLAPTKELVQQLHREMSKLIVNNLKVAQLSGSNMSHPEKPWDILVSTPTMLVDTIDKCKIDLSKVELLVIDEADKLFDHGHIKSLDKIMTACTNKQLKKALFSATIDSNVEQLASSVMMEPVRVVIGHKSSASESVEQKLVFVGQQNGKFMALANIIDKGIKPPVLIFVSGNKVADELQKSLLTQFPTIHSDTIHSDKTASQREESIKNFRSGKTWLLITTDLLGRGIDFKGVNMVINYDFPHNVATYIHRIGRCGRNGRRGEAVSFFMKSDRDRVRSVAHIIKQSGGEVPEWMTQLKKKQ